MKRLEVEVLRHGPKEKSGLPDIERTLTVAGRERMRALGQEIAEEGGQVDVIRHSVYQRTRETAETLAEGLGQEPEICEEVGLGADMAEMFSGDELLTWKMLAGQGEEVPVKRFLDFGKQQPDAETWSPYQIAQGLARVLVRAIDELRSGEATERQEIHVSHSSYIEALLMFLGAEEDGGNEVESERVHFIDRIGGILEMGERGPQFEYTTDDAGAEKLSAKFRGREYAFSIDRLRELAN